MSEDRRLMDITLRETERLNFITDFLLFAKPARRDASIWSI